MPKPYKPTPTPLPIPLLIPLPLPYPTPTATPTPTPYPYPYPEPGGRQPARDAQACDGLRAYEWRGRPVGHHLVDALQLPPVAPAGKPNPTNLTLTL